ncbi:alpha/beta fold hydrolase [Candidatus Soleaferrea massiliensis]|uniref:alpha/beta fold hydrolase n=1 Tax=Candidatus Soleaferrea massiliensis TaxID=1470354 RepID=UPI00058B8D34|nr:alpha/beta hydrolase [Candidatus Soleaferrea massiliensis]
MFYVPVRNRVKIAVYDLNPCGRRTVLMIHGWPLSEKIFEYQKLPLLKRGYRVVTLDLRGYGNSDAPAGCYCYNQMAEDIYRVVRALHLRSFTLVGFSMGGAIVLRYMRRYHGYGVRKLVLLSAAAPRFTRCEGFPYGTSVEETDQLIEQAETDRAQLSYDFSRKLFYSEHSDAIKDFFEDISQSASGIATVKSGYALRNEDGCCDLEAVHVPTGIFHGTQDVIVPYELGVYQHKHIKNSRIFTFEHSGHGIVYDELERFNRAFLDFLDE